MENRKALKISINLSTPQVAHYTMAAPCTCGNKISSLGLIYGCLGNSNTNKFAVNETLSRTLPTGWFRI